MALSTRISVFLTFLLLALTFLDIVEGKSRKYSLRRNPVSDEERSHSRHHQGAVGHRRHEVDTSESSEESSEEESYEGGLLPSNKGHSGSKNSHDKHRHPQGRFLGSIFKTVKNLVSGGAGILTGIPSKISGLFSGLGDGLQMMGWYNKAKEYLGGMGVDVSQVMSKNADKIEQAKDIFGTLAKNNFDLNNKDVQSKTSGIMATAGEWLSGMFGMSGGSSSGADEQDETDGGGSTTPRVEVDADAAPGGEVANQSPAPPGAQNDAPAP